jgi:hypothetical protein
MIRTERYMDKIRYSAREAQAALGIGNTKFWSEVKAGRIQIYYDGAKAYCSRVSLERYDAACQSNTTPPSSRPRAKAGAKGVQAP